MLNRMSSLFISKIRPTDSQPNCEASTVIWVTHYSGLKLTSSEEQKQSTDLIVSDIKEQLSKIDAPSATPKQVHLSYQAFIESFEDFSNTGFSHYNCFTVLSVPTECLTTGTSSLGKKQFTWLNKKFSLLDCQIQSFLILNENLDLGEPVAHLFGKMYQPLSILLSQPNPNLEKTIKELIMLFSKNTSICQALRKPWKSLLEIFEYIFSQKPIFLQESFIRQAVLNLLASSPSLSSKLRPSQDALCNVPEEKTNLEINRTYLRKGIFKSMN